MRRPEKPGGRGLTKALSDGPKFGDKTRPTATIDNRHTRTLQGGISVTESRDF